METTIGARLEGYWKGVITSEQSVLELLENEKKYPALGIDGLIRIITKSLERSRKEYDIECEGNRESE